MLYAQLGTSVQSCKRERASSTSFFSKNYLKQQKVSKGRPINSLRTEVPSEK